MIRGQIIIVSGAIGCIAGIFIGVAIYSTFFCVDINKAVVKQLKKDSIKVEKIEKKAEVRNVKTEKAVANVKRVASDECLDSPYSDDIIDELRHTFNSARP